MKNKKNINILIIVSLSVLLIMFLFIFKKDKIDNGIVKSGVLNGVNEEDALSIQVDPTKIFFEINAEPYFENGYSEGNLRIANPPYNAYDLTFTIVLDKTGEKIFESGTLKPYEYIENARLKKVLESGSYEATSIIEAYDKETKKVVNIVEAKLIITVK